MNRLRSHLASLLFATGPLVFAACDGGTGPLMKPGENCMMCHSQGGGAHPWTIAGTVFNAAVDTVNDGVAGVTVTIIDANNKTLTLTTNAAGNFYSRDSVTFPIAAQLNRGTNVTTMKQKVSTGACSSCHTDPPSGGAPGRNFIAAP